MNKELDSTTTFLAGDFTSENAVRDPLDRRPRSLPTDVTEASDGETTGRWTGADDASPRASRSRPLRRWSIAELMARAVVRPPHGGVAH